MRLNVTNRNYSNKRNKLLCFYIYFLLFSNCLNMKLKDLRFDEDHVIRVKFSGPEK